ncbi:DUF1127 domain-containing protein [Ectopseudomonas khazarica]|nr:DUF1127 domain-containing protein [Pseudomonas khazarica]|tara:strand:+ start:10430 stop:10660 length:231 start_codon:yes stop_codon:yes gene_type:complete
MTMTSFSKTDLAAASGPVRSAAEPRATRYFGRNWPAFWRRLNTRGMLRKLNDQQLRDIGLTRAQAEREVCLPFWKL